MLKNLGLYSLYRNTHSLNYVIKKVPLSFLSIDSKWNDLTMCMHFHLSLHGVFAFAVPAPPRQCIDLFFDEKYSIEPSWECKFDHIEVRDGPFGFSPIIGRYCGQQSPQYIRSSGRYLWIKFVADGELEAIGFSANYNFTTGKVYSVYAFGSIHWISAMDTSWWVCSLFNYFFK